MYHLFALSCITEQAALPKDILLYAKKRFMVAMAQALEEKDTIRDASKFWKTGNDVAALMKLEDFDFILDDRIQDDRLELYIDLLYLICTTSGTQVGSLPFQSSFLLQKGLDANNMKAFRIYYTLKLHFKRCVLDLPEFVSRARQRLVALPQWNSRDLEDINILTCYYIDNELIEAILEALRLWPQKRNGEEENINHCLLFSAQQTYYFRKIKNALRRYASSLSI